MIRHCVAWCTRHSLIVVVIALLLGVNGELARRRLSRDAVPDLSDPQIGLVVEWMGHPASEVATRVTQVLTEALKSVPAAKAVRGASMSGMAYVDILFGSSKNLEPGRREIQRRVETLQAKLPPTIRVHLGPPASATGWVYQYALVGESRLPLAVGHRLQDELLRPQLEKIPGVAEVASVGGTTEQMLVETNAEQLRARDLAFSDLVESVRAEVHGNPDPWKIDTLPLHLGKSDKRLIGDVAHTNLSSDMPIGVADLGGNQQVAGGIIIAKRDADPKAVIEAVEQKLQEVKPHLPRYLKLVTIYNRMDLANRVEHTLLRALAEEVGVVVLVILMFLLHGRSALVPALTLPLVLLLTFGGMYLLGIPATIMSLGGIGIALGMAVDADVVALEACHRRIETLGASAPQSDRRAAMISAAGTIAPAILTSLLITALSFLPVFAFTGETGRLLRPLATTKTLVILAAAIVAVTAAPALRDRLVRGRILPEFDNPITKTLVRIYRPFVTFALARPTLTLATAALAAASCFPIMTRLGGEFLPRVDEGDLLFMPTTLPGASVGDSAVQLSRMDKTLAQFPEVAEAFGKVGRANSATDPAPFSMAETTIRLKPRAQWPKVPHARWYSSWAPGALKSALGILWPEQTQETTAELVDKLDRATRTPGWASAWTAPARARMDMMSTGGVRTPVGIRIVAANPARLDAVGTAVQKWAAQLPHTKSAVFESLGGEPWLRFDLEPAALAKYHVDPALALSTADFVISGGQVSELTWHGPRGTEFRPKRFVVEHGHHPGESSLAPDKQPYRLRVAPDMNMKRVDADQLREITVRSETGEVVPLGLLGHPRYDTVPASIRTEDGELVAYVYVDPDSGTDVSSYVKEAQQNLSAATGSGEIHLEPAERIEWTGQYQLMAAGQKRLLWIAPMVAILMFGLLLLQFRSVTEALIVLISVPFALVGSLWTLFLLHYPMSAPVWVGLLSTVGLAMQTGVVMVVYIDDAFQRRVREGKLRTREDIIEAHAEGTVQRLRPKLMTIATMAVGLLPLLWTDGAGAEIMKRVAAPMLGGLVTSAFLTLEVIPVLYTLWRSYQLRLAQRDETPIEVLSPPSPDAILARAASRQSP
ncbi:MAG TPA: efflux RND transporter permease subunit [Polyangiaceae bacterium]|nr:efflux RND transporter permease subunit [Polyangiaceae bacterium]